MKANVSAKGSTSVLLVLNMKGFIQEQDQARFDKIRGTEDFAKVLREIWPQQLVKQKTFVTIQEDNRHRGEIELLTPEQSGLAAGVFRPLMLEKFSFPTYALDKEKVAFNDVLMTNFQFRSLVFRTWQKWSIYIRPTNSGLFVLRLTSRFEEQSRSFIKLTQDVLRLQESLDVLSAQNWLKAVREKFVDDPEMLAVKERSVSDFLAWLGVDENYASEVLHYPVQWRIAMEVCNLFVREIGPEIMVKSGGSPICFEMPKPSGSIPLQDPYIIYNFTEVLADANLVKRLQPNMAHTNSQVAIGLNDIRESPQIRQAFVNLLEGDILKADRNASTSESSFPRHRRKLVDEILDQNQATWSDDICLLRSRIALILPSPKLREHELLVSSLPGSHHLQYATRWNAVARGIEFVIEGVSLIYEIENISYSLLTSISRAFDESFAKAKKQVPLRFPISELISSSVHLRRLSALCQEMSNPRVWSQSEKSISLFSNLFHQINISISLENIDGILDSLSNYLDLYLAEISDRESRKIDLRSIALAAASLTLTLLMLPSFYVDAWQLASNLNDKYNIQIDYFVILGTALALGLFGTAIFVLFRSWLSRD